MAIKLDGDKVELVIVWNFHQAVRVENFVVILKHG